MPSPMTIARTLGAGRATLGVVLLAAPDRVTARWVGQEGETAGGRVLARTLGVRDLVIGLGSAAGPPRAARRWILAGLAADVADAAISGSSQGIPRSGRIGTAALAGGAAVLGAALLATLD